MRSIRDRVSDNLPAVLLTMFSIIQAIALESLWFQTVDGARFDFSDPYATLFWLMSLATLMALVSIWISYVALAMRFIWTPSLLDIAFPFFVGLFQFALIEFASAEHVGLWLINASVLFLILTIGNQRYFRKAREDSRNAEFFDTIPTARKQDFMPQFVSTTLVALVGIVLLILEPNVWIAIIIVGLVLAGNGYFLAAQNRFWKRSIAVLTEQSETDD